MSKIIHVTSKKWGIIHLFLRGFLSHFSSRLPHFYDVIWLIFESLCPAISTFLTFLKLLELLFKKCWSKDKVLSIDHGNFYRFQGLSGDTTWFSLVGFCSGFWVLEIIKQNQNNLMVILVWSKCLCLNSKKCLIEN